MTAPLLLEEVSIVRLSGIDEPFAVTALSPGVNVVFGPNASGKSSLIRAIEAVLWPPLQKRPLVTAAARFHLAGDTWQVRVDGEHVHALRNSVPADAPLLPSPELRHRYRLSLHDLLGAESGDGGFAVAIARASVGGLDLAAAADALGVTDKPPTRLQARTDWEASRVVLDKARQQSAVLHREAEELAELERKRDDAAAARHDLARLDAALQVRDAAARAVEVERALSALPESSGALSGREFDEAESLLVQWRQLLAKRTQAAREQERAHDAMREQFVHRVPTDAERLVWRALASRVQEYDERCEQETLRLAAVTAERDHARQSCGTAVSDTQLAQFDRSSLDTLLSFSRRFELAHSVLLAAEQQRSAIPEADAHGAFAAADALRDQMRVLTRWLAADARASARAGDTGLWWWVLLALAVLAWILLAVYWHWSAALGAAVAVLVVLAARFTAPRGAPETAGLQREFETLRGVPPAAWTRENVLSAVDEVARALTAARAREHNDARRADAERAITHAQAQLAPLDAERVTLIERYGLAPEADAQTLPWFVHQLVTWSDAHRTVSATEARLQTLRTARTAAVDELRVSLAEFGESVPDSTPAIVGLLDAIELRATAYRDAARTAGDARRELQLLQVESEAMQSAWRALLERAAVACVELPDRMDVLHEQRLRDALAALEQRMVQRATWQELLQRRRDAHRDGETAAAPFATDDAFPALTQRSPDELRLMHTQTSARADGYTSLVERTATLRHRVHEAKGAHDVEAALARLDERGAELARAQQLSLEALVGQALLDHVQEATRDVHRPAVFHRARELFARITHGRWQLSLEENDAGAPGFRAIDSRTLRSCALDELSSGTRVQLLVAVRMAFVEITEGAVRLPVFLDEALGTSDDQRAQALIDAALELARDGRQLFYFTAQQDEVAKWRAALDGRDIAWREFDLAQVRRGSEAAAISTSRVHVVPSPAIALPDPERHTHHRYGASINVPAIEAGVSPVGTTHPWYVIDHVHVLHEVLSLGVYTWGELQWYIEANGRFANAALSPETLAMTFGKARTLMRAVEVMHREARIGRGDPVDRTRLVESGVSSARLLDAVSAVAGACDGDAIALIAQLEGGAVAGFGPQRVTQLRERLQQIGCLDDATPRTAGEIRLAMIAAVSHELDPQAVDDLLARITAVRNGLA